MPAPSRAFAAYEDLLRSLSSSTHNASSKPHLPVSYKRNLSARLLCRDTGEGRRLSKKYNTGLLKRGVL